MRALLQRVSEAEVSTDGISLGSIGRGLVVLLGVAAGDADGDAVYLAEKITHLRIFPDEEGLMNLSLLSVGGAALVVSQFTLYGDCRRGRRPGFSRAAPPDQGRELYLRFIEELRARGVPVAAGRFQAAMQVRLVNDGPVTLLLDSAKDERFS